MAEVFAVSTKGANRDWYADVGAATRQAIERANAAKLSDGDRRVFNAVIGLLASYSRLTDHVYRAQVAAQAGGLSIPQTSRCLKKLAGLGIIVWEPVKGRKRKSLLGLPPAKKTNHEDAENESSNDGKRITQDDSLPRRHPEKTSREEGPDWRDAPKNGAPHVLTPEDEQALLDLVQQLPDADESTPATFRRAFRDLDWRAFDFASDQVAKRNGEIESPAAYAFGLLRNVQAGYSGWHIHDREENE